jgi:hypothetical protein
MDKSILILASSVMLLASCGDVTVPSENASENGLSVSLLTEIEQTSTRTAMDSNGVSTFQTNDKIGLIMNKTSFSCWTLNGSTWSSTTSVYWNDKSTQHTFEAFYPYAACSDREKVPVPVLTEQSGSLSDLASYDFLVASASLYYTTNNGIVAFTGDNAFEHKLTLVKLNLKFSDDMKDAHLNSLTLSATGLATRMYYSFDEELLWEVDDDEEDVVSRAKDNDEEEDADDNSDNTLTSTPDVTVGNTTHSFYYVLNPVSEAITVTLNYTTNDKTYTASGTLTNGETSTGNQYETSVTVNDNVLSVGTFTISKWGNGGSLGDVIVSGTEVSK